MAIMWVGERLLPHTGTAEVTVPQNQFAVAAEWLIERKWDGQPRFGEAWARIRSALYEPEFFHRVSRQSSPMGAARSLLECRKHLN